MHKGGLAQNTIQKYIYIALKIEKNQRDCEVARVVKGEGLRSSGHTSPRGFDPHISQSLFLHFFSTLLYVNFHNNEQPERGNYNTCMGPHQQIFIYLSPRHNSYMSAALALFLHKGHTSK